MAVVCIDDTLIPPEMSASPPVKKEQPQSNPGFEHGALEKHMDALYRLARYLTRKSVDADDLVQTTYLRAIRFSHRFQPGTRLRAWLFQIMRNEFYSELRRLERESPSEEENPKLDTMMFHDAAQEGAEAIEVHMDLYRAMERLPTEFRTALLLAEVEGLPLEEVARIMATPDGTVKSRMFRAKEKLREYLRDYSAYSKNGHNALEKGNKSPAQPDGLNPVRQKKYGDDPFAFFRENFGVYSGLSPTRFTIAYGGLRSKLQEAGKWQEAKSMLQQG